MPLDKAPDRPESAVTAARTTAERHTLELKKPGYGESEATALARNILRPELNAAITVSTYTKAFGTRDWSLTALADQLEKECDEVQGGSLVASERMLAAQAHSLDALFNELCARAARAEYLPQVEAYMRLALKAQSNCRTTWESLAEIKTPRTVAFVRQANIAGGHQQVNNSGDRPRARKALKSRTKLLEAAHGERLDNGTTAAAIGADTAVEAVGEVNRSTKRRG
jgi:hypothetical protein